MAGHKRESGVHKQETNKDGEIQSVSQAMEKDKTASNPPSTSLLQTYRKHQVVQLFGGFKDKEGGCCHPLLLPFLTAACSGVTLQT